MAVVALTAASITSCSNDDKNDENGTSGGTYRIYTSGKDYSDKEIPGDAKTVKQETTTWASGTYMVSGNVNRLTVAYLEARTMIMVLYTLLTFMARVQAPVN